MPYTPDICTQLIPVAVEAGRIIMDHYNAGVSVSFKKDQSPVTQADTDAEDIILAALANIVPDIPVISEEAASKGIVPDVGDMFFLVDPLDGTREFIKHNDEFTVNIGLIKNNAPLMGIVYAPALGRMFFSPTPDETFEFHVHYNDKPNLDAARKIQARTPPTQGLTAAVSRSHIDDATYEFLKSFKITEQRPAGSSLKFCLIAAGEVDVYPRTGPTMEWDTAAGHAVLSGAGGSVITSNGESLAYGKSHTKYLNPNFTAWGKR